MAATAAMVSRLRRMVAESDSNIYDHEELTEIIERYPVLDSEGLSNDDEDWMATYDLNAAAAEVWAEKAAALVGSFDFGADGATFTRSQQYDQAKRQARYYGARRQVGSIRLVSEWVDDDLVESD